MSILVPSKDLVTSGEAGQAFAAIINPDKVSDVLWFTFKNKTSVVLFAIGISMFLVLMFFRMIRKI